MSPAIFPMYLSPDSCSEFHNQVTAKQRRALRNRASFYQTCGGEQKAEEDEGGVSERRSTGDSPEMYTSDREMHTSDNETLISDTETHLSLSADEPPGADRSEDATRCAKLTAEPNVEKAPPDGDEPPLSISSDLIASHPVSSHGEVAAAIAKAAAEEGVLERMLLPRQQQVCFETDFCTLYAALWSQVSIVVGLHPDEATETIVDLALEHGKPFAVVPCCVFWKANQHRRCKNGAMVTTHAQYCRYLEEKHPAIRRTRLGFEGRNVLLSYDPAWAEAEALCPSCDE